MNFDRPNVESGESRFAAIVGGDTAPRALTPEPLRFMRTLMDVQGVTMPTVAMETEHALPWENEDHRDAGTGK